MTASPSTRRAPHRLAVAAMCLAGLLSTAMLGGAARPAPAVAIPARAHSSIPAAASAAVDAVSSAPATTLGTDLSRAKAAPAARVSLSASKHRISPGKKVTLTVRYVKNGKKVARATVRLRTKPASGSTTTMKVRLVKGIAKVTVKPRTSTRFWITAGGLTSASVKVTVSRPVKAAGSLKPATSFTIAGSGFGHGVGMAQYGAYALARSGKNATQILTHYYSGTAVTAARVPDTIAVQVFGPEPYSFSGYADTATSTTFAVTKGSWRLVAPGTGQTTYPRTTADTASSSVKVTLKAVGGKVRATVAGGGAPGLTIAENSLRLEWSGTAAYSPSGTQAVAKLSGANGTFRHGQLTATVIKGKLNVVNELALTDYLYGIAEMPSSWGRNGGGAALAAQAITARSYALVRMKVSASKPAGQRKAACNCHVVDDVRDQNFTGWSKEGEKVGATDYGAAWTAAVDSTVTGSSAQVLTHQGVVIATYYYSSSGGATANSEDVWSATVPYLRSVTDTASLEAPGNSLKSWTSTVSAARLASFFGLPDLARVEVVARYSSGQVKTVRGTSSTGKTATITAKADVLRFALGSLRSAWLTSLTPNY